MTVELWIGQEFDQDEYAEQDQNPRVSEGIIGRGKFDPVGVVRDGADDKQGNVGV